MYEYGEIRIHLDELIKSSGLSKKRFSIQEMCIRDRG